MFDPLKFKPLGHRILVKVLDHLVEEKTKTGIIIPSTSNRVKKIFRCEVVALSDYFKSDKLIDPKIKKPDIQEGDVVYIENNYMHRIDDTEYAHSNAYDCLVKEIKNNDED